MPGRHNSCKRVCTLQQNFEMHAAEKKKSEFKEKIDNFTIIDGNFNTLSSEVDRIISGPYVEKGHYDSP